MGSDYRRDRLFISLARVARFGLTTYSDEGPTRGIVTGNSCLNTCRAVVKRRRDDRVSKERRYNSEANEPSADHVTLGQTESGGVVPHHFFPASFAAD